MKKLSNASLLFVFILVFSNTIYHANAVVSLPSLFSNGMVLQQKSSASVWGWADAGEVISINTLLTFHNIIDN